MRHQLPPSLQRFSVAFETAVRAELTPTLAHADRPEPSRADRAGVLRRPRVLAGGTLGLAGIAATVLLALGGTAATSPAFGVTRQQDGSVLLHVNTDTPGPWLRGAERQLAAMGVDEHIAVSYQSGAAAASGPIACTPWQGARVGTPLKILLGSDGTQVIPSGNTGAGSIVHLGSCVYWQTSSGAGNTGAG